MASTVEIILNSNPLSLQEFIIQDSLTPSQAIRCRYSSTNPYYFPPNNIPIGFTVGQTAQSTYNLLQRVYNNTNLYTITIDFLLNKILITANSVDSSFTITSSDVDVDIIINNEAPPVVFEIDLITVSQASSNECDNVELTISTNQQATNITSPVVDTVSTNPYIVEVQRTGFFAITMNDLNNSDSKSIDCPALVSSDFILETTSFSNNGTVTINNTYTITPIFTLQYSLDGGSFVSSNSFSGLDFGSHTMSVRDSLGCSFTLPFEIGEITPQIDPRVQYSFVSNSGSFRFKVIEDLSENIPTINNTLSYEENVDNNNRYYKQPYQKNDGVVTQQFNSSYENNEVFYMDCFGNEVVLGVVQKTQNINIEDLRGCTVLKVEYKSQSYVGIQFGSGNLYDPVTLEVTGTYALGNEILDWLDIGEWVNIEAYGWIKILDFILIDEVRTVVVNSISDYYPETIPQQGLSRRFLSYYNKLDYEVYEFSIDLSFLEGDYQIRIDKTDPDFEAISYLSEWINVKEKQGKTHLVEWYNTVNNEINYSTGIRNKARFSYIYNLQWLPSSTNEVFITNTNTISLDSTVREFYLIKLSPIPTGISQKFILLLANDRVFIDKINFVKENESETTHYLSTNLHQINQQLTKSNFIFDSNSSDGIIGIKTGSPLAIEGLGNGLLFIE